jgi:hypothetical protein
VVKKVLKMVLINIAGRFHRESKKTDKGKIE